MQIKTVAVSNNLRPDLRVVELKVFPDGTLLEEVVRETQKPLADRGYSDFIIFHNGTKTQDLSRNMEDGDNVVVCVNHGIPALVGLVWVALWNLGMYTAINFMAYAIAGAIMIGAGILVQTFLGAPKPPEAEIYNSASYGFAGTNPTEAGLPIPVVFGAASTICPLVMSYRTVDTDYSMWQWMLFAASVGQTNDPINYGDVFVGEEPLSARANWAFDTTDGSDSPSSADLSKFDKIRHDRAFTRILPYNYAFTLTTKGPCNSVVLILEFTNGLFALNDDGSMIYKQVDFYVVTDESSFYWSINKVTGAAVRESKTISFSTLTTHTVTITRLTGDDPGYDSKQRSTATFIAFIEEVNVHLLYPGVQMVTVGIKATDNVSGQVPPIRIVQSRDLVAVRNWTDTGYMNVTAYCPPYVAYFGLTDPRTGRGISPTKINKTAWEEWELWCSGLVDGVARAECHIAFDENGSVSDNLFYHVEQVGRAKIVQYGDTWTVLIDKPRTSSYVFSRGNIIKNSFSWETYEKPEKVDAVEIIYWDSARNYQRTSVIAKATWFESLTTQPKIASIELRGCITRDQALREATFRMQKTEMITRHGKLQTGPEAIFCERGEVVEIIHPTNVHSFSGRLGGDHSSASLIRLDQYVNMAAATYSGKAKFFAIDPDGDRYELDVVGPWDEDTQVIEVDGVYTGSRFDTFAIARPNEERIQYQLVNKKLIPAQENSRERMEFEFVEYVDAMFYHSSWGSGKVAI